MTKGNAVIRARRKGGKAKSAAKVLAARANGKLGGRPRNADRTKTPLLFLGHFGFDSTEAGSAETEDGRFTLIVYASHINDAIREFRRFLKRGTPESPACFDGVTQVTLLSCSEIRQIPSTGFMPFHERIMRDHSDDSSGGISIANVGASRTQAVAYSSRNKPFITLRPATVQEAQNGAR